MASDNGSGDWQVAFDTTEVPAEVRSDRYRDMIRKFKAKPKPAGQVGTSPPAGSLAEYSETAETSAEERQKHTAAVLGKWAKPTKDEGAESPRKPGSGKTDSKGFINRR